MKDYDKFDLNDYMETQVNKRCEDIIKDSEIVSKKNLKLLKELEKYKNELKNYKKEFEINNCLLNIVNYVNVDNIRTIFNLMELKTNSIELEKGMYYDKIPKWFRIYWNYYPDRVNVLLYFDLFKIDYDKEICNFIMPNELSKDYVLEWVKNCVSKGFVNSAYLEGNGGFFYKSLKNYHYKIEDMTTKKERTFQSHYLPWQYMLMNPNILDDDVFDLICKVLEKTRKFNSYNCSSNFYSIVNYQELDDKKLERLSSLLPNTKDSFFDIHKNFINKNKNILKTCPWFEKHFLSEITSNSYSSFFFGNFSDDVQIKFLDELDLGIDSKIKLIDKSTLSRDDKNKLIKIEFNKKIKELEDNELTELL